MIFNVNSGAGKQPVNVVPSTSSAFTYDGSAKTPLWQNFDSQQLSISGATSAVNAGNHTVYFTPKADYEWWDGTSTPKEVTWSIAKASGSLSLSATSATVTGKNSGAKTFTVTRAGDGKISVTSSNTGVATASVSGTTVTVTPKGYGSATTTVSVAAGTNHNAPGSKTYSFTVDYRYLYKNGTLSEISAFYGKRATVANSGGVLTATSNGNQYCLIYSANMISNLAGKRITVVFNSGTAFYPYEYSVVALASSVPTQDLNNGKVTGLVVSKNINLTGTTGWTQFSGNCSLDIPASLTGSYYLQLSFAGNSQLNGKLVISQIRIE